MRNSISFSWAQMLVLIYRTFPSPISHLHQLQSLYTTAVRLSTAPKTICPATRLFSTNALSQASIRTFPHKSPRINPTPSFFPVFISSSLLPNFSRDPTYELLPNGEFEDRSSLFLWLVQENKLLTLWKGVDQGLEREAWEGFVKTIVAHGDQDELIPYYMAKRALGVVGLHDAQLFTAIGKKHFWDMPLFLGDPGLKEVEEAWKALDEIIFKVQGGPSS
ncbi:uncharacterized protein EAE97_007731 [Botrytis byssoidea]|uniref:Uncharacterized protein n=1 Tax=Botrytis byssoidea TaxID=139641 RepID=A0A9P5LS51_9HELO|nr:uncharacterized protein EAE97_007731 [Botrytis byssoidea]KAF7937935.1 hypothetical protein EAE97_007731 [Botrytis byssoidea]